MAKATITQIESVLRFTVNTENINSNCVYSPEFEMSNLKWKVKLIKRSIAGSDDSLAIHLETVFSKDTMQWSCEAEATFKLLQQGGQLEKSVVKRLSKSTFDVENLSHGVYDFMKWDAFLKNCAHDNRATIEVGISTSPLKRKREKDQEIIKIAEKVMVEINDAKKLVTCFSPQTVLQDIRWRIECRKEGEFLAVFMNGDLNDMDINWSYKTAATFTLLTFDKNVEPCIKRFVHEFGKASYPSWGYRDFLKWSDFVDDKKHYISPYGKANLLVEFKVEPPEPKWKLKRNTLVKVKSLLDCCICFDSFMSGEIFSIECGHLFCKPCFDASMTRGNICPTCQAAINPAQLHPIFF